MTDRAGNFVQDVECTDYKEQTNVSSRTMEQWTAFMHFPLFQCQMLQCSKILPCKILVGRWRLELQNR